MIMNDKEKNIDQSRPKKKSYSSPVLTRYGSVSELTSGGTKQVGEMNPMQSRRP